MYTLGAGRILIKSIIIVCRLNLMAWKASWAHRTGDEKKMIKTATGKFLPNRFLANSPSTSSGLRGFKSLDLYNIRFTEYILCHFDHVSRGT